MSNLQNDVICFYYDIQDLAEHVFKLTSYAGRMFSPEAGDYLLDRVKANARRQGYIRFVFAGCIV